MSLIMADQAGGSASEYQDQSSFAPDARSQYELPLSYQPDYFEENPYLHSGQASTFTSPRPAATLTNDLGKSYRASHGALTGNPYQQSNYHSPMQQHTYPNPGLYGRVTPEHHQVSSNQQTYPAKTGPGAFTRENTPPKRRKATKKESAKPKSRLEQPLSVLTAHLEHIPIKDTEAWVNRPIEVRRKEVGKDGFVKRPSNSFILYRSAYADRCREYEKSNNHQDISSMAGTSWGMEHASIRKQYEEWAKVERENHHAAFPDYKFQPQTQDAKAKKRKEKFEEDSLGESDPSDLTYLGRGFTPETVRSSRSKKARNDFRDSSYTPSIASEGEWGSPKLYPNSMYNASCYQTVNPDKPVPSSFSHLNTNDGYYHAVSQPNLDFADIGHVEDVMYQSTERSLGGFGASAIPNGLPGISHEDLLGDNDLSNGHLTFTGPSLDPELISFNQGISEQLANHHINHFQDQNFLGDGSREFGNDEAQVNLLAKWDRLGDDF